MQRCIAKRKAYTATQRQKNNNLMLLLGIDIGTSFIKATVVDAATQRFLASASYPEKEAEIINLKPGWAEQDPAVWWENIQQAILKCHLSGNYDPKEIGAIGIAYQMHGLVLVDKARKVLRRSIIWCDSRSVEIGHAAFDEIGRNYCLSCLLNSPGNFTASKMAWVKSNEPENYKKADKIMLPGDYAAMMLTGEITTTISALSEGIFWDFGRMELSRDLMKYFDFSPDLIPEVRPLFSEHGKLQKKMAGKLNLKTGIPVCYKAGDQPNNALALNVMRPGEVAATAGTSGVIYGVSDKLEFDPLSRINSFAHVNYSVENPLIGILLCINGTGIFNSWFRKTIGSHLSYKELNAEALKAAEGSSGLFTFPFGNGAERMLGNKIVGAHFNGIDLNVHGLPHLARAVQEGIAYSFRYGLDIMRENGISPEVVRAAKANLFLSDLFAQVFADVNDLDVEYYEGDGSYGAAIGAGLGAGVFKNAEEAAQSRKPIGRVSPSLTHNYGELYEEWKVKLSTYL